MITGDVGTQGFVKSLRNNGLIRRVLGIAAILLALLLVLDAFVMLARGPGLVPLLAALVIGAFLVPSYLVLALVFERYEIAVLLATLLGLVSLVGIGSMTGMVGLLVGMVLGTLPVPIYVALATLVDRYEKEPTRMLGMAFLWGATISWFFAAPLNLIGSYAVGRHYGAEAGNFFMLVVSAPIAEELCKGLALFLLFWWKRGEFDGVVDGVVYAAMVGLGFATVENFLYYGTYFVEGGIAGSLENFLLRGVLAPFMHPLYTSLTGIGLGLAYQSSKTWAKYVAPPAGLLAAMFVHSMWTLIGSALGYEGAWYGVYLLLWVPVFIGVLSFTLFSLRREERVVREYLTPELRSNLLSRQEYDSLVGVGGRLGSFVRVARSGGVGAWRARSRFEAVASELAFHRYRISRGITSADDARREDAYLRLLRELKGNLRCV